MPTEVFDSCKDGQSSKAERQKFMESRYEECEVVAVTDSDSIKAGDHLVLNRAKGKCTYDHHMLCTSNKDNLVKVIHYTGPVWGISNVSRCTLFKDFSVMGGIEEKEFSLKELLEQGVKKVIWPDELKLFSEETDVIKRAFTRLHENWYDMLKNNCEHFVTWCICGEKLSSQVKQCYLDLREIFYSVCAGVLDFIRNKFKEKSLPFAINIIANISDEVAASIAENGQYVGFVVALVIEALYAAYEIYKANGFLNDTEEFKAKLIEIIVKGACRLGCGIVGSCIGTAVCPAAAPIASLVGGAMGAGLGHFIGAWIGQWYEKSRPATRTDRDK